MNDLCAIVQRYTMHKTCSFFLFADWDMLKKIKKSSPQENHKAKYKFMTTQKWRKTSTI